MDYLMKELPTPGLPINLFKVEFVIVTDSAIDEVSNHLGHTLAEMNYGNMDCILFKPMGSPIEDCEACRVHSKTIRDKDGIVACLKKEINQRAEAHVTNMQQHDVVKEENLEVREENRRLNHNLGVLKNKGEAAEDKLKIATALIADTADVNETLRLRVDELENEIERTGARPEVVQAELEQNGCELTAAKVTLRPLRYYRKAAMLKQSEMGELLGVSGSVISRLESGQWNALKKERFLEIAGLFKELQGLKS